MTKLEELIYSLATVLVRYHDSQLSIGSLVSEPDASLKAQKSRTLATSIVNSDEPTLEVKLSEVITNCTSNYNYRQHFLKCILNELIVLKSIHSRTDVLQKEELQQYKDLIFQMFQQFKQLLTIKKTETTVIKYSTLPGTACDAADITLSGLLDTTYFGAKFCTSGKLLLEEVFYRLDLTDKSSSEEIQSAIQNIVGEYQNKLIADTAVRERQDLLQKLNSLEETLERTNVENLASEKSLTADLTKYKTQITKLEVDLGTAREENSRLRREGILGEKENQIKDLERKVSSLQKELDGSWSGTSRVKHAGVFNPLMFGFTPKHPHPSFIDSAQQPKI